MTYRPFDFGETVPGPEPLSKPWWWDDPPDNRLARTAVQFFRALPHVKGPFAKEGLTLGHKWMDWQERLTRGLFGLVDDDGNRIIQTAYVEMPKKTAKSTWAAGLGLYGLTLEDEYGAEVYSAAYDEKQAKVVWTIARMMIERDPEMDDPLGLADELDIRGYKNEIECPATGSVWTPLSREVRSKHGFNPSLLIFDELHTQPNPDMWGAAQDSMGARSQPLLFAITNAGFDRESVCYLQREYALKVNGGMVEDPSFLGLVYGVEEDVVEDGGWQDPGTWKKAHPGLGVTVSLDWMAQRCEKAKAVPSEQNIFQRWQLSIWTGSETRYIPQGAWDACGDPVNEALLIGRPCYSGLDLASKEDIAALVHVFPGDDGVLDVLARFWIPEAAIEQRSRDHGVPYREWLDSGLVEATPGSWIDYAYIESALKADAERYDIREIAYDRWGADQLVQRLGPDGENIATFVGVGQGFKDMTEPTKELLGLVLQRKIRHGGNRPLRWMCDNMMVRLDPAGNVKPDKKASSEKIDGMVALIMAVDRHIRGASQKKVVWLLSD